MNPTYHIAHKGDVQEQLQETLKAHKKFLKALEKASGLKIKKTSQGKAVYELEPQIISDFAFEEDSILLNLSRLESYTPEVRFDDILYTSIFDETALKKIRNPKFQDGIADFISASDEIYGSFEYLEKGQLTLPKLKDLKKSLEKDSFFVKDNYISLSGEDAVTDIATLNRHISAIETQIDSYRHTKKSKSSLAMQKGPS